MKRLAIIFFSLALLGCATSQNKSNFTDPKVKNYFLAMQSISDNTSEMLINVFPPAQTKFKLTNEIEKEDVFGKLLLNDLRNAGYGIFEIPKEKSTENQYVDTSSYIPFSYILKNERDNKKNYNLILNINNQVITRSYTVDKQGNLTPNSSWTKRN